MGVGSGRGVVPLNRQRKKGADGGKVHIPLSKSSPYQGKAGRQGPPGAGGGVLSLLCQAQEEEG